MLPNPDDLGRAPLWENYVIAQLTQASLGLIPRSAVALGVVVDRYEVTVWCQLRELTAEATEDLDDIVGALGLLVGDEVRLRWRHEIRDEPVITPQDRICWTFAARM